MENLPTDSIRKFNDYLNAVKAAFIERDDMVNLLGLGLVSGLPTCFIGEPGTSKSKLIEEFANNIDFNDDKIQKYFGYLITKYTHPDELFGKPSLKRYKNEDVMVRNTDNSLVDCRIAFLDEIFKGNSPLLNSTLGVSNEKKFNRGANEIVKLPLKFLTAASNEYPIDDPRLRALWDRWIIRAEVQDIHTEEGFIRLLQDKDIGKVKSSIDWSDIQNIIDMKDSITYTEDCLKTLVVIKNWLKENNIRCSDRRWRNITNVLQSKAAIDGRKEITSKDCRILSHVIWENPKDRSKVNVMLSELCGGDLKKALSILDAATELHEWAMNCDKVSQLVQAKRRILEQGKELSKLEEDSEIKVVRAKIESIHSSIMEKLRQGSRSLGGS